MEEEKKQDQKQIQDEEMSASQYVENIKKIKEGMVSKEDYDKVVAERNTLAKAMADGEDIPSTEKKEKPADIKEMRKTLLEAGETNITNAEYVQNALKLREALIAEGKRDPFLPRGLKREPNNKDYEGAQRVADALQGCLDDSRDENGKIDPEMFNAHMKKIIANDSPIIASKLKKLGY